MATLRYLAEFQSMEGEMYKLYIDDNSTDWIVQNFNVSENGFDLNYPVQTKDSPRVSYVMSSVLSFNFLKRNAAHDSLQDQMVSANEERFKIQVLKNDALFWCGFVLTDNIQVADEYYPTRFNVQATDGLGRLKGIDYNNDGVSYSGRETILNHIFNCLNKIPLSYFHASSAAFLKVIVNWYEDQHAVVSTLNPLAVTDVDHSVFIETDSNGNTVYKDCLYVLKQCLQVFGARLYQSGGVFVIEQINERESITFSEFTYDKDKNHILTSTSQSYELAVNTASNSVRPRRTEGGIFAFYPPLNKVCITYNHSGSDNLLLGSSFHYSPSVVFPPNDELTLGDLDLSGDDTETILISGKLNFSSTWINVSNLLSYRHIFYIKLKVGSYYLKREIVYQGTNVAYGPISWSLTESYYQISTNTLTPTGTTPDETTIDSFIDISFITPIIEAAGEITFDLQWNRCEDTNSNLIASSLPSSVISLSYTLIDQQSNILQDGEQINMETSRNYCATNEDSDKNTVFIDDLETVIGDGPFAVTFNKLKVYNGSEWKVSDDWRVNDTGTAYKIQELLIRQILAGQKTPIKRYEGSITGDFFAHTRLNWDSEYYLFEGGTFRANSDTWSGRWFNVFVDDSGISTEVTVIDAEINTVPIGDNEGQGGDDGDDEPVGTGGIEIQGSGGVINIPIDEGFIEFIELDDPLEVYYQAGDLINIVDQNTGNFDVVTVTAGNNIGDTTIEVEGYVNNSYPVGAIVVPNGPDSTQENQLSGEIISNFFEATTIEKAGYFLKTNILLPVIKTLSSFDRSSLVATGLTRAFYNIPLSENGGTIESVKTSFATAGAGGTTIVEYKKNGTLFETATLSGGTKQVETTITPGEPISTDDEITIDVTTVSTSPPSGMVSSLEINKDVDIYLNKIGYQLNRVERSGLLLWSKLNYNPQISIIGGSAHFSSNSIINCGNDSSLGITGSFSICAWFKFEDNSVSAIAGKYSNLLGYHLITLGSSIAIGVDSQSSCSFLTTGMTQRTWYHIAATYDGTTAKIYLDGAEMDTATYTAPTVSGGDFWIGGDDSGAGANFFDGNVAGVRLWSRALSQLEIQSIYIKRFSLLTASEKLDMVSAWELSDISGSTAPDSQGSNNGTIT